MEATISRIPAPRRIESAVAQWLHANRHLARTIARATWETLVANSRAGLLVKNGSRSHRRL